MMSSVSAAVSKRMKAVRRKGTACEADFEAELIAAQLTYTPQYAVHKCTADFCFPDVKVAVFVDGDFWHGRILVEHGGRALRRSFKSERRTFWIAKITRNVERDRRQTALLRRHGWSVLRFWEKDVKRDCKAAVASVAIRIKLRRARFSKRPSDAPLSRERSRGQDEPGRRYRFAERARVD